MSPELDQKLYLIEPMHVKGILATKYPGSLIFAVVLFTSG